MKRITWLVGIASLAAMPVLAQAQAADARPFSFGVSGGASLPMGDLGDVADVGYNLGAHVLLMPASLTNLSFRGDVTFDRWSYKGAAAGLVNAKSRVLGISANAIFKSSKEMAIKPYVIAGGGLYNNKFTSDVVDGKSKSKAGLQGGGGLEFKLSGFTTFVEAKYVNVFGDGASLNYLPVTFGIRF